MSHKNTLNGAKEALAEILSCPQEGELGEYCRMCDDFSKMKFAPQAIAHYRFFYGESERLQDVEVIVIGSEKLVFSNYMPNLATLTKLPLIFSPNAI